MKISVIMPAYNVRRYIDVAISSVIAQTYRDWHLIVVDDGSTDGGAEMAPEDDRVLVIRQANAGVSAARNRGLAEADGDAVLFLDADDWLAPDALARLAAALAGADAVAACGTFRFVTENGAASGHLASNRAPDGDLLAPLLVQNLFANGGHLLIRRAAIGAAGRFATGLRYGEDWEYWCRLALRGRFVRLRDAAPVLFVRQRSSGAYLRMASDPTVFAPCMAAIFENPDLLTRFGAARIARLRRSADAENAWIIGRELVRHGRTDEGRRWLTRSVRACPTAKRVLLLLAAFCPGKKIGPFQSYAADGTRQNG